MFAPVNSTVPSTSPRTTVEPILQLSPWYIVTGRDSPVKAAWSTSIFPLITLKSAGTLSPDLRRMKSPGTTKEASSLTVFPSLLTVASGFKYDFKAMRLLSPLVFYR